jgi:DNA-damage-inducible protein D
MKEEVVKALTGDFESYKHKTPDGVEFWYARELLKLLGYSKWENFERVIYKAIESCKSTGGIISDHFPDIRKMIKFGKGAESEIKDYMLTRYACYLIAQNGDPSKSQIAFAQAYFATQTRNFELLQNKIHDLERLQAREKLAKSEKQLSGLIYEVTKDEKAFGYIRSLGDKALFGLSTADMKIRWGIPKAKPLADFAPTVVLKGKDFANEMTIFNTHEKKLKVTRDIADEHQENNSIIRKAMVERGIVPESIEPEMDIKKVKSKIKTNEKNVLKKN